MDLMRTILELKAGLAKMRFSDPGFRDSDFMRVKVLTGLLDSDRLAPDLRWTGRG